MARGFPFIVIATVFLQASAVAAQASKELVKHIASEPQLFLDDWLVAKTDKITRTLRQPKKHGLLKNADGSLWDRGDVYHDDGNIVTRDKSGRFHMTYRYIWSDPEVRKFPQIGEDKAHWFRQAIAYAWSDDGVRWHKPKLGLVEGPAGFKKVEGFPFEVPAGMSKENNLGCPFDFIVDLHEHGNVRESGKRFLLRLARREDTQPFAKIVESSMHYAADWPDFARDPSWKDKLTPAPGATLSPRGFKTLTGYDAQAKVWFALTQDYIGNWLKRGGRDIVRFTSPDLATWSGPELALAVPKDEPREPGDWVEYMSMTAYRAGGPKSGLWLGQLHVFHSDRSDPQYMMPTIPNVWRKGLNEVRLVSSRDAGKSWQRVAGKQNWLPHHAEENGYDRLLFGGNPVRVDQELWFYYPAWDGDHLVFNRDGSTYYKDRTRVGRTARATLRLDGYLSLDAGKMGGDIVTHPVIFEGKQLHVNLAAPDGELRVELQDEAGKAIPGFALADCLPTKGDGVRLPVRWRGKAEIEALVGRPVRLHFALKSGSLYGFQFE